MTNPPAPEQCRTMQEVRAGVDATDRALIDLLARRFRYIDAAARIKPSRNQVRDEARKSDVIAKVKDQARSLDLPADILGELWDRLVEASIAHEFRAFDERARLVPPAQRIEGA